MTAITQDLRLSNSDRSETDLLIERALRHEELRQAAEADTIRERVPYCKSFRSRTKQPRKGSWENGSKINFKVLSDKEQISLLESIVMEDGEAAFFNAPTL